MKFNSLLLACCASFAGCSLSSVLPPPSVDIPQAVTPETLAQCPDFRGTFEDWDSNKLSDANKIFTNGRGGVTGLFCVPYRDPNHPSFGNCLSNAENVFLNAWGDQAKPFVSSGAQFAQAKKHETFQVTISPTGPKRLWLKFQGSQGTKAEGEAIFFVDRLNTCKDGVWIRGVSSSLGGAEGSGSVGLQVIRRLYRDPKTGDFISEFETISVPRNFFGAAAGEPKRDVFYSRYKQVK